MPDPRDALARADAAFVGTLVSRRQFDDRAVLVFSVERGLKGPLGKTVEVVTARDGAGCGIEAPVGSRLGLVLDRRGGAWHGHLCAEFAPEDLLAAASLPAPNGRGAVALLVSGRFGPARTLALDAKGRTLAYGIGAGRVLDYSTCPGGRRVAELVELDTGHLLAVRELGTLQLVREQRLENRYFDTAALRCANADGEQIIVFRGSGPDLERRARLVQITPARAKKIWQGMAWYVSFQRRSAYVQVLSSNGTTIVAVDLRTGSTKTLGTLPLHRGYRLTANPTGTRLAGDSYDEARACCARLHVVDLKRRPISFRSIPLPTDPVGSAHWVRDDRLAYVGGGTILVYSAALRLSSRMSGWRAESAALVASTVFGVHRKGTLVAARLPFGPVRLVRRLPGRPEVIVSATR